MTRGEFEELAGCRIGAFFYDDMIEPMYNALPEFITKQEFAKLINVVTAQKLFYEEMISRGALGLLNHDILLLFNDLDYLSVIERAFPESFIYTDTDSIRKCFKGGYTHAKPIKEGDEE